MTSEEFTAVTVTEQFREKLISKLTKDYPGYIDDAEDTIQKTLMLGFKRADKFMEPGHLWTWLRETSLQVMFDKVRKDKARRKVAKRTLMATTAKVYNPTKHLDWKIDLERGIATITSNLRVRQALWANVFEDYTWEEVIEMSELPHMTLARNKTALKREMRRKGYNL